MDLKHLAATLVATTLTGCALPGNAPDSAAQSELAPTGKMRFGIVYAPEPSVFFALRDTGGQVRGVTVDLANDLAARIGRPVEFVVAPNSGQITDALASGRIDAAFMPIDDERRTRVDFGAAYAVGENTYLVSAASGIKAMADVDRPAVRVIGISGTTTIRSAMRTLKNTTPQPVASVEEALAMVRDGRADAFALTHDTLIALAPRVPGSRILDGAFNRIYTAVAVPKGRPAARTFIASWLEATKADGTVQRVLERNGFGAARPVGKGEGI